MSKNNTLFFYFLFIAALQVGVVAFVLFMNKIPVPFYLYVLIFLMILIPLLLFLYTAMSRIDKTINKIGEDVLNQSDKNIFNAVSVLNQVKENYTTLKETQNKEIDLLTQQEAYRREFLGDISHELKTPLFSIQGYVLTLIEGGVDDIKIRDKYLNRINKSTERLSYIVRDLDLIADLESGVIKINPKVFNIVAVVQEVFDLLEMKAQKNNVSLHFNKKYDNIKVYADIEKIEQVLINLIVNAIKHSHKENTKVAVGFVVENTKVMIKITDDGQGISQEHIKRIFDRFYRIEKSRNRKSGGSGLGLSIVKHILEAHQEKIEVRSIENVFTTFSFALNKA